MSTVDIIILIPFLPAIWRGVTKGFIEQATALTALLLGAWMSYHFSAQVCEWLRPYLEVPDLALSVISYAAIVTAVVLLLFTAGKILTGMVRLVLLGWLDRLLGFVFAMLQAGLLTGLVIILFDTVNLRFGFVSPETLDASQLYAPLRDISYTFFPYLKEFLFKQ